MTGLNPCLNGLDRGSLTESEGLRHRHTTLDFSRLNHPESELTDGSRFHCRASSAASDRAIANIPTTLDTHLPRCSSSNLAEVSIQFADFDLDNAFNNDVLGDSTTSPILLNQFASFSLADASGDSTANTVFQGGALRFSYTISGSLPVTDVYLQALQGDRVIATLGNWSGGQDMAGAIVNLSTLTDFGPGTYQIRAVGHGALGIEFDSVTQSLEVLAWNRTDGTFAADSLNYTALGGNGAIVLGRGGTDTLNLGNLDRTSVMSLNGSSLDGFNPLNGSTAGQAIFGGTAFDYLTLADGREIYFQGIESLTFADGQVDLQVRTNDPLFGQQWNLHVTDVDSAWRFTQGSSNVLLVSLDNGILTAPGAQGGIVDIDTQRLITDPTDDNNGASYGHGHSAISIMSANPNNGAGIAGINWNSPVLVTDVYGSGWVWQNNRWEQRDGVTLQQGIQQAVEYARAHNQRIVFQTGVQGESWLTNGGTRSQLEQLIQENADIALFAVSAGNGYRDIDDPSVRPQDTDFFRGATAGIFSGGVARLQTTHSNVMAVGALRPGSPSNGWNTSGVGVTTVNGLVNATAVSLADYSNFGTNLTLVAPTDSPAMDKLGNVQFFGGTSAANPNLAGIASLVWSANPLLTASEVRQILMETAMDLGTPGRDATFGSGLVNADAAVRRSLALSRDAEVAQLYGGAALFV